MTATDEELVARSQGGDLESFNQLILRWERPIYALAYRVIGREEDARDVCQDTFLRAYRALPGFKGQAKFSSWLYRIALNLCRDWIRRQRRAPVSQMPEDTDAMELASETGPVESIEDLVARRELSAIVEKAMGDVIESVKSGGSIAAPLRDARIFPSMVAQMIAVGEETGNLDTMLTKVSDFYEDEVAAAIKALTSILEPVMIVLVGGIVGFIVIAMYMPMFKVYDAIK